MKKNYKIDNIIENIYKDKCSPFLDIKELRQVSSRLKKESYSIYELYEDSDYKIIYKKTKPDVVLIEINTSGNLRHQDILGAIMSLGTNKGVVGDIILFNNKYYFYTFRIYLNMFVNTLNSIANNYVVLRQVPLDTLDDYKRMYEENEMIVSSLRIDTIISRIINSNRRNVLDKIKNKEIILNYDFVSRNSIVLKEGDVFSIRKYGKYKFIGIVNTTKKDNFVVKYYKYL